MRRVALGVVLVVALFGLAWLIVARGSGRQVMGQVPAERDRLSYGIMAELQDGGSSYKTCYFDAEVALRDGKVERVQRVAPVVVDRVSPGSIVQDLPSGLERGQTIPLPVHFASDGKLHAGYDYCKEEALP